MGESKPVSVIVDPFYGTRLEGVVYLGPVWIVDSLTNRPEVEKCWSSKTDDRSMSVTIFTPYTELPEQLLVDNLDMIDLHHNGYSAFPAYVELRAIGAFLTLEIQEAMKEFGFDSWQATMDGFVARKPPAAAYDAPAA